MGWIVGYICECCPLAFEAGEHAYWSQPGERVSVVCGSCGTMHRLETERGVCSVWALPAPVQSLPLVTRDSAWGNGGQIEDYEWPFAASDWRIVTELTPGVAWGSIACARCKVVGRLTTLEQIKAGNERCPVCSEPLMPAYYDTVD